MLALRRSAAPSRAARLALAVLTILCASVWATVPAAHAETGELLQFGSFAYPPTDDTFYGAGPVAVDPTDGSSLYVTDHDAADLPHLRKFAADGTLLASASPPADNPGGQTPYVVGLAVDRDKHRLYVLLDADDHGPAMAKEIAVYSTVPDCTPLPCTLVPPSDQAAIDDGVDDGVLIDFRAPAGGSVDYASGLAVDEGTGKVAVLGIDDNNAADANGVLQYVTAAGELSTRLTGLGAGPDPGPTAANPAGLAIDPTNGDVYIASKQLSDNSAAIYRLPRETATPTLFVRDTNTPQLTPGFASFGINFGVGSPISISSDGATLYVAEGDGGGARARGYATATATPRIVYGYIQSGAGEGPCWVSNESSAVGLAAGAGNGLVMTSMNGTGASGTIVHVFGDGGTGCPRTQALFTVDNKGDGTVTVTKGQTIAFDAGASQLLGGTASQVDWDFDGSGAFATHVTPVAPATAASLATTHKFLTPGTYQVGVRIEVDGAPPTDPVFHQVKVVAPTPSAAFKVSNRTPAAGGSVTFDAGDSTDPAGSDTGGPSHELAKYRWDFGDGQSQETTTATVSHAFANAGTAAVARTVKLSVVSKDDVASGAVQQTVTVAGTPAPPVQETPQQQPQQQPPGGGKTTPIVVTAPSPTVAATSVDAKGVLSLKVTCPAGGATCTGKVELTIKVKTRVKGKTKTTTLKLGTATFTVAPGKSQAVKLKLSSAGKALLKKQKKLSVAAAVSVTAGGKTTTKAKTLTLKAPAKKK